MDICLISLLMTWFGLLLQSLISTKVSQFHGFGQHDCQEFLGFFMDGLHEVSCQALCTLESVFAVKLGNVVVEMKKKTYLCAKRFLSQ